MPVEKSGYITDLITDRAISFISRKHDQPFFLSLNYTAPHWPWEGPGDIEKSKTINSWLEDGGSMEVYASIVKSLDSGIGKVLSALKKTKLDSNTLIIFTSDNGGERFSFNWPFTGKKYDLLEGGIRVPAFIYWKNVVPVGKVTDQVAITMDWTKTILSACQAADDPASPIDGIDLLPVVKGDQPQIDRKLFWRTKDQNAVRHGKWKYYKKQTPGEKGMVENEYLFDLNFDQMEKSNFKEEHPEIFSRLKEDFLMWDNEMLKY